MALSRIHASRISSIDDPSNEASECATWYDQCLRELLELHDWNFAIRIATLAALGNDRTSEWGYAYAAPSDLVTAIRMIDAAPYARSGVFYPWPYTWSRSTFNALVPSFLKDGGTIYSNNDALSVLYTTSNVSESDMPAMFKRALSLNLAAVLASSLLQNSALTATVQKEAELARQRAMADDLNRSPQRQHDSYDEVALARGSY